MSKDEWARFVTAIEQLRKVSENYPKLYEGILKCLDASEALSESQAALAKLRGERARQNPVFRVILGGDAAHDQGTLA